MVGSSAGTARLFSMEDIVKQPRGEAPILRPAEPRLERKLEADAEQEALDEEHMAADMDSEQAPLRPSSTSKAARSSIAPWHCFAMCMCILPSALITLVLIMLAAQQKHTMKARTFSTEAPAAASPSMLSSLPSRPAALRLSRPPLSPSVPPPLLNNVATVPPIVLCKRYCGDGPSMPLGRCDRIDCRGCASCSLAIDGSKVETFLPPQAAMVLTSPPPVASLVPPSIAAAHIDTPRCKWYCGDGPSMPLARCGRSDCQGCTPCRPVLDRSGAETPHTSAPLWRNRRRRHKS